MTRMIAPPKSVLLLVGREDFTPPSAFDGKACTATADCLAVAVIDGAPAAVTFGPAADTAHLIRLGDFDLECEGLLSLRDVYSREYDNVGLEPGLVTVTVWGDDDSEPSEVVLEVRGL